MRCAEALYDQDPIKRRPSAPKKPPVKIDDVDRFRESSGCSLTEACDNYGINLSDYIRLVESQTEPYKSPNPSLQEIDEYMDEHQCSVFEACRRFGMSVVDYDKLSGEYDLENEISAGLSRELGSRAIYLLDALNEFSHYSKLLGLEKIATSHDDVRRRYGVDNIDRITKVEQEHFNNARASFIKAFGATAMIKAGLDSDYVQSIVQSSMDEFINKYVGPANKKRRAELRKILVQQSSSVK